jgi:hypothetical protein
MSALSNRPNRARPNRAPNDNALIALCAELLERHANEDDDAFFVRESMRRFIDSAFIVSARPEADTSQMNPASQYRTPHWISIGDDANTMDTIWP